MSTPARWSAATARGTSVGRVWLHRCDHIMSELRTAKAARNRRSPRHVSRDAPVAAVAAKVCEEIERMEGSVQEGLEAMYSSMSEDTFKAMRRVMPITRTKMNWSLSDVKLKQNLTAKH